MNTQTPRQSLSILVALALCMALQMTGYVMILPLFARRFERFGAGVEALGMSAMAVATLLLALFLIPETMRCAAHPDHSRPTWMRCFQAIPASTTFFLLMLISFGVMFAWAFIEPQFMFYVYGTLSWTSAQLGLVMSTYRLACTLGEFLLGQLSDRWGRKPVLVLGLALLRRS